MKFRRVAKLLSAFLRVSRERGVIEAGRKGARRVRNRFIRPILDRQDAVLGELSLIHARLDSLERIATVQGHRQNTLEQLQTAMQQVQATLEERCYGLGHWHVTLEQRHVELEQQHARTVHLYGELEHRVADQQQRHDALDQILGDYEQQNAARDQHRALLEQRNTTLEQHHGLLDQRLVTLEQRHDTLGQQHSALEQQQATIEQQHAELGQQHAELGQQHAKLGQQYADLERQHAIQRDAVGTILHRHSLSVRWLAENHSPSISTAPVSANEAPASPRISVIMAAYNREEHIKDAIESVLAQTYPHWELLVIDDGSTDGTREAVDRCASDPRIRSISQPHSGAAVARNRGLAESRGEIITYLDTDNVWYPGALAAVVSAFADDPHCESAYFAQVHYDHTNRMTWIHAAPFDHARVLEEGNTIDLNAFAHRRRLVGRYGGFDMELTRLMDWDLILRYTADRAPKQLPVLGGRYEIGTWERITSRENLARNRFLVRSKFDRPVQSPPRVLYALWHYPQLSETYIATEIECMRRWGVHVETWSEIQPASPFATSVPIHYGSLSRAIERVRPDIIHVHWIHKMSELRDVVERAGLYATVRGHSFEFTPDRNAELDKDPVVRALYTFPQLAAACPPGLSKIRPMNSCFNPDRYWPPDRKDTRLVLRAGSGLPSKDYPLFIRVAKECPDHRFVCALVRCNGIEEYVDEMMELNRSLGSPVDMRVNVQPDEMAALMREAGIYMHTHSPSSTYGMPVSICESMATGGYVIGRRCPGSEAFIGDPARCYDDEEQAIQLIRSTTAWSQEQWHQVRVQAVDRAYGQFADTQVLRPILNDWLQIMAEAEAASARPLRITA